VTAGDEPVDGPETVDSDDDRRRRAVRLLLLGEPLADVIAALVDHDYDESEAAALCGQLVLDPVLPLARDIARSEARLRSVLLARSVLLDLSDEAFEVRRRKGIVRQKFLDAHYVANRPVVLTDSCDDWPALAIWSMDRLSEALGAEEVSVVVGSGPVATTEPPVEAMLVKELTGLLAESERPAVRLAPGNRLLDLPAAAQLWDEMPLDARYLRRLTAPGATALTVEGAGSAGPFHAHERNQMLHQVVGRRQITLVSPLETPWVYNSYDGFSEVDPANPDLGRHPEFARAHPVTLELRAGQALFLPVGWWHQVRAEEVSIGVTTTSFVWPNDYDWFEAAPLV
jgi:hypothetical protein